jgi:uncharacterized protein (DUF1778 family)
MATTKKPMKFTSVMLPDDTKHLWTKAARVTGISQSQFLREALHEKASDVLSRAVDDGRTILRTVQPGAERSLKATVARMAGILGAPPDPTGSKST